MENFKRMAIVVTAVIASAMALTACGGSDTTAATTDKASAETTAATTAAPAETTTAAAAETTAAKADEKPADDAAAKPAAGASKDKPAKKGKSVVAKKKEEAPAAPAEPVEQSSVLAEAFGNTVWVGMDSDYNVYALVLGDEEIKFMADDGSEISGYWGVADGDPNIYIFSDAELTDCIFVMPFAPDTENNLLVINDTIVLTPTEAHDTEAMVTEMQNTATACKVAAYLDGTYWAGVDDTSALAFSLEGDKMEFYYVNTDAEENVGEYNWSLDYNYLTLYDAEYTPVLNFGWDFAQDGSWLKLISGEGQEAVLTQVSDEDAGNIVNYLHSLIEGGAAEGGSDEGAEEEGAEEEYAEE